jgi:hypothetical protein
MTEAIINDPDRNGPDRGVIDGSPVVAREIAQLWVPASKNPGNLSPCSGIEKVLLEDGREVYQCDAEVEPKCNYWHEKGESVRAHLRKHSEKTKYKIDQLKAERDELLTKQQRRAENYSNGARKAAATKKLKREQGLYDNPANDNGDDDAMTIKMLRAEINRLTIQLEGAVDGLDKVGTVLTNIRGSINNAVEALDELGATEINAVDPVLAEKAAKWDSFQGLMGQLPNSK